MRIVSNFKDYYDGPSHRYYTDKNQPTFSRYQELNTLNIRLPYSNTYYNQFMIDIKYEFLWFCNKMFPFLHFVGNELNGINEYAWNIEQFRDLVNKYRLEMSEHTAKLYMFYLDGKDNPASYGTNNPFDPMKLMTLEKAENNPIIHFKGYHRNKTYEIVNPCLRHIGFPTMKDSYTAWQELRQWFCNKTSPEKDIPRFDEKVMMKSKGMDKWSFRRKTTNSKE